MVSGIDAPRVKGGSSSISSSGNDGDDDDGNDGVSGDAAAGSGSSNHMEEVEKLFLDAEEYMKGRKRAMEVTQSLDEIVKRMELYDAEDSVAKGKPSSPRPTSVQRAYHRRHSSSPLTPPMLLRSGSSNSWAKKSFFEKLQPRLQ